MILSYQHAARVILVFLRRSQLVVRTGTTVISGSDYAAEGRNEGGAPSSARPSA